MKKITISFSFLFITLWGFSQTSVNSLYGFSVDKWFTGYSQVLDKTENKSSVIIPIPIETGKFSVVFGLGKEVTLTIMGKKRYLKAYLIEKTLIQDELYFITVTTQEKDKPHNKFIIRYVAELKNNKFYPKKDEFERFYNIINIAEVEGMKIVSIFGINKNLQLKNLKTIMEN